MKKAQLKTKEFDIDYLLGQSADYNPREIDEEAKSGLSLSIDKFGYVQNLIFNKRTKNMVSGHQRLVALKEEGYDKVDVLVVDLDEEKEKELNVLMNTSTITGDFTEGINDILEGILSHDPELYDMANLEELRFNIFEGEEEEQEEKTEVDIKGMDLYPYEHYDCVLVVFKSVDDFLYLSSKLGLNEKRIISAPMVANKKIGRTRAVDAKQLIKLIEDDQMGFDEL
jgi:hypothetical protein